jgi:hypothetical protein
MAFFAQLAHPIASGDCLGVHRAGVSIPPCLNRGDIARYHQLLARVTAITFTQFAPSMT